VPQTAWVKTDEGLDPGHSVWVTVGFRWEDANQMRELTGRYRGLEVKLRVDGGYASNVVSAKSNFGGYLDTPAFDDACCTFAWGTADLSVFRPGVNYEVEFQLNGNKKPLTEAFPMGLDFQATSDVLRGVPEFDMPLVQDAEWFANMFAPLLLPSEAAKWWENSKFLADAWEYTEKAGTYPWRMFGDSMYTMIRRFDTKVILKNGITWDMMQEEILQQGKLDDFLIVSRNRNVSTVVALNQLSNPGFEASKPLQGYKMSDPRNKQKVYCQPGGGYGSNCFLQFNGGSASAPAILQDVTLRTLKGDHLTAEAMIRCPVNQASCVVTLELSAPDNGRESRAVSCTIPSNGRWYSIRLDGNHGFAKGFVNPHARITWGLHNLRGNLDVDAATLADGYSTVVGGTPWLLDGTEVKVPNQFYPFPSAGSACSQMD